MDKTLKIGTHSFQSRLMVGTGKYKDFEETKNAITASGAEVVTVALRRTNMLHFDTPRPNAKGIICIFFSYALEELELAQL